MGWYSILPSHLTTYETWIIRVFLILATINLAPWVLAILYDLLYYICRQIWHEIPFIGGRAQGAQRPRAPSFKDRARRMSLKELVTGRDEDAGRVGGGAGGGGRGHRRDLSKESIEEESEDDGHENS